MKEGIILSILDTDLYKFTTGYAYAKLFPSARGRFEFFDRNDTKYPKGFDKLVKEELQKMSSLRLTKDEAVFLRRECPYLPPFYIDYIKGYQYDPSEVEVHQDEEGRLRVIAEGLLYRITMWETPILAIISELFYKVAGDEPDLGHVRSQAIEKAELMKDNGLQVSIFGMRRRFSSDVEDEITALLKKHAGDSLFGTSNVYFAMKHGIRVTGTHPHEWVQFHAAMYGYKMANYMSMEHWINVYDGDLGTVLTDTYTTDVFMKNFSKKHAMLFTSLRHDSGDPYLFVDKAIKRYKELRIDPMLKYLVFSDSLNIPKAIDIKNYCKGKITATFGIGTNLTNDVGHDVEPMNIVMKLVACQMSPTQQWHHCVKLSDVKGKHIGNLGEIKLAEMTLGIDSEK